MRAFQPGARLWLRRGHWLGVKSACQLRQESFPGTDPASRQESLRPHSHRQVPQLKPSVPPLLCVASLRPRPRSPKWAGPGLWPGHFGPKMWVGGRLLISPGPDGTPDPLVWALSQAFLLGLRSRWGECPVKASSPFLSLSPQGHRGGQRTPCVVRVQGEICMLWRKKHRGKNLGDLGCGLSSPRWSSHFLEPWGSSLV